MRYSFQVQNMKCGGCAQTISKRLREEHFSSILVDTNAKSVSFEGPEGQEEYIRHLLKTLGYPVLGEEMGFVDEKLTQAKSFVSCAIGRLEG